MKRDSKNGEKVLVLKKNKKKNKQIVIYVAEGQVEMHWNILL